METEERGPGDGRRLAVGDAGFGEPWRRVGDEREFRLRPRKPTARNERVGLGVSLQNPDASCPHERELEEPVVGLGAGPKRTRPYNQRCAVRSCTRRTPLPDSGEPSPVREPPRSAILRLMGSMVAENPC